MKNKQKTAQQKAYTILAMVMIGWIGIIIYGEIKIIPYGIIGGVAIAAFGRQLLIVLQRKTDEPDKEQ